MPKLQKDLYLKHDLNTLKDEKIILLDEKFPHVGYSIYWRLLEYMQSTSDCEIQFEQLEFIARRCIASEYKDVKDVLDYSLEIGLFLQNEDKTAFYSKRLRANREEIEGASLKGEELAKRRWNKDKNKGNVTAENIDNANSNANGNANSISNKKKTKEKEKQTNINNNINNNVSCTEQTSLLHAGGVTDNNDLLLADDSTQYTDFTIPLNDGSLYHVTKSDFELWEKIYPAVDVAQQLRQMAAWSDANTRQRKTRQGVKKFIVTWLGKEQDKARTGNSKPKNKAWQDAGITFEGREY